MNYKTNAVFTFNPRAEYVKPGNKEFYGQLLATSVKDLANFVRDERMQPWVVYRLMEGRKYDKAKAILRSVAWGNTDEAGQAYELAYLNLLEKERKTEANALKSKNSEKHGFFKKSLDSLYSAMNSLLKEIDGLNIRENYEIRAKQVQEAAEGLWGE